jgi:hypothetical protein
MIIILMSNNLYNNDYTTLNNLYSIAVSKIDLYGDINQDVGNKSNLDEVNCNNINIVNSLNTIPISYFNTLSGNIQNQINQTSKLSANNNFTGSLNTFNSINCNNNIQTLTINNSPANYLEGLTQNIQQKLNSLTAGSPINGSSATVSIGNTSTLAAGSLATVTNTGTPLDGIFNFGIPTGPQGIPGNKGDPGINGVTPIILLDSLVDNLASGSTPYVTMTTDVIDPNIKTFKFGLVKGIDGITPTILVDNIVDNLVAGSTPYVLLTTDLLDPNKKTFKFGLVRGIDGLKGDKGEKGLTGDKGDKGEKGDKGDSGGSDALSIAGLVLGSAGLAVSIGTALALFAEQLGLSAVVAGTQAGGQGILATRVSALENKTNEMVYTGTSTNPLLNLGAKFIFYKPIVVNSGQQQSVVLNSDGACSFGNGLTATDDITTTTYLRSKYLSIGTTQNTYLEVITGKTTIGYKTVGTSTETNIISDTIYMGCSSTASTINVGVGKLTDLSTTTPNIINIGNTNSTINMDSKIINIGTSSDTLSTTVNIGNVASTVNIYGNFAQFTKQERKFTKPKLPFLG